MGFIGERSYSMYLTHMVCIVFVREFYVRFYGPLPREGFLSIYLGFFVVFLIFSISEFSYRFLETPLRNVGRNFTMIKTRSDYVKSSKGGA
jgi:peptidoglycan/LPS O-acetylase OafA/YrhL